MRFLIAIRGERNLHRQRKARCTSLFACACSVIRKRPGLATTDAPNSILLKVQVGQSARSFWPKEQHSEKVSMFLSFHTTVIICGEG